MIIPITEIIASKTMCVQPWVGAVVDADGRGALCCEITEDIPTHRISTHTLGEMQHAALPTTIREQMLAGTKPPQCWRCYSKEEDGVNSLRNTLNTWYATDVSSEFDTEHVAPINLELRFGNLCQLQCVMCHPSRSRKVEGAQYYALTNQDSTNPILLKHYNPVYEVLDFTWMKDPVIWETQILPHITATKRIFINGGEPLLVNEHFSMLRRLIELGVAADTTLIYSTNLLAFNPMVVELWKHYKLVSVAISIDDIRDRNYFIRYPTNWSALTTALDITVQSTQPYSNIKLHTWCAINQLNFPYLGEYVEFFETHYPSIPIGGWRGIDSPSYLSPGNLPTEYKQQCAQSIYTAIDSCSRSGQYGNMRAAIAKIVQDTPDPELLQLGLENLRLQGEFRQLDISTFFPHFTMLSK